MFSENKYTVVDGVVSKSLLTFLEKYCTLQIRRYPITASEDQVPNTHHTYADPFMETLLLEMLPIVQVHTGLTIHPTYSFYRIYKPGDKLDHHIDRPSCEISTSLHIAHDYTGMPDDYNWNLCLESTEGEDIKIALAPGDMAIYRGLEIDHWREKFDVPESCWHMQVFLHYVDANGPWQHLQFDGREGLGFAGTETYYKTPIEDVPKHFKYLKPGDGGHPYSKEDYANLQTN